MKLYIPALALSACALPASAGSIVTYEFTGEITQAFALLNDYVGIQVGDAFVATVTIDTSVMPTQDDPDRRSWDRDALLRFDVELPDRVFTYVNADEPFSLGQVVVTDNQDVEGFATRDEFFLSKTNTRYGVAFVSFNDEDKGNPPPADNPLINGLDLPTADELNPMLFQDADLYIGGQTSTGFVDGVITGVRIVPAPASALAFAGLGAARRRR